ncbi:MAG: ATP synthase Fo subunit C [Lachnospiraceae bacterium]|nr:ATP synthase Fo subunit C [Lachnospiraceae bacterium]
MEFNEYFVLGCSALGAALAVFTAFGPSLGQGQAAGMAAQAVSRNPGAVGDIRTTMLLGQAFSETGGLYGLVVAILLLIVKPLT